MRIKKKIRKSREVGLANRLIDRTFHPHFSEDKSYIIVDTALHFIVERDPPKSFRKFLRYSLKYFV